ncbi:MULTISPECIES: hypothetical protein [unclassified Clostridium]|nr:MULTISPECIES: hypothetical protein [unclassified Clostridium]
MHNLNNAVKEVKKVNVSVIGALIFFYCTEILLKTKITRIKR